LNGEFHQCIQIKFEERGDDCLYSWFIFFVNFAFTFLFSEASHGTRKQHLDQSLSLNGIEDETFLGRPFGVLASCEEVEWRLKRDLAFQGFISTEDRCNTDSGPS
jgi:hypothetical protein